MTTSTTSATTTRAQASPERGKPAGRGDGQAFSSVLTLKLGMGLNAAVEVAQSVPPEARERTAEPARDRAPREARSETETRSETQEAQEQVDADATEATDNERVDAEAAVQAARDQKRESVQERAPQEAAKGQDPELRTSEENPPATGGQTAQAETAVAAHAAVNDATERTQARETQASQSVEAAGAAGAKASPEPMADESARPTRRGGLRGETATTVSGAGKPGGGNAGASKPDREEIASERGPQPRDPLGLIREARPEPVDAPRSAAKVEAQNVESKPLAEPAFGPQRHAEPARVRFADAGEEQASRAAASAAAAQVGTQAVPVSQAPGSFVAGGGTGRVGSVGATSGGGGAGVGGGGVGGGGGGTSGGMGSGAGNGMGLGHEFGGLFAAGRGVAFGAGARGKGAVGVAAAKGDSKEQIQAQISRGLAAALRQKGGVMSLRLNPEHLGSMKIDLTIESGRVTATFDAQSEQARQALRDGVDGLKRSIEEAGLTVKTIEVVGTPPISTNPGSPREDKPSQTPSDAAGQQGQRGEHRSGQDRREQQAPWAQERPDAHGSPEAIGGGGVWAEEDGSASGLLRLRVDAVV